MRTAGFQYDPRLGDVGIIDGGILSDGYGIVAQKVMRDRTLPRDARFLYAYLMTFMNGRFAAFPGVDTQIEESGMSRKKYYAMRAILEERDLIRIEKGQRKGQRNSFNIYYFNMFPHPASHPTALAHDSGKPEKPQVAQQFQCDTAEKLDICATPARDSGKPEKPQVAQQFQCDTGQNETPNYKYIHSTSNSTPSLHPTRDPLVGEVAASKQEAAPPAGRMDGREGQGIGGSEKSGSLPSPSMEPDVERQWSILEKSTVNRNLIRHARTSFDALVAEGFAPSDIRIAWDHVQDRARSAGKEPRYFPQLKRWLENPGTDGARGEIGRLRKEGDEFLVPPRAPKTLAALAAKDEVFRQAYCAYVDAASDATMRGDEPGDDPKCRRLLAAMRAERKRAYRRLALRE